MQALKGLEGSERLYYGLICACMSDGSDRGLKWSAGSYRVYPVRTVFDRVGYGLARSDKA